MALRRSQPEKMGLRFGSGLSFKQFDHNLLQHLLHLFVLLVREIVDFQEDFAEADKFQDTVPVLQLTPLSRI